jgi:hypothetical protein
LIPKSQKTGLITDSIFYYASQPATKYKIISNGRC